MQFKKNYYKLLQISYLINDFFYLYILFLFTYNNKLNYLFIFFFYLNITFILVCLLLNKFIFYITNI